MRNRVDHKLRTLSRSPFGEGSSLGELITLGRVCDVVRVEEGTVLQTEGSSANFCWSIVRGAVTMSRCERAVAVASAGAWLLDGMSPPSRGGAATTVVASTDLEVVVFGRREIHSAVESVPSLARALSSASR